MKLIDADRLIKESHELKDIEWNKRKGGAPDNWAEIEKEFIYRLEEAPEAIVRCKDCVYHEVNANGWLSCNFFGSNFISADFYCMKGELAYGTVKPH